MTDHRPDLENATSFIEQQFPVAKISMESYKERTGKQSQTLTGLGKWWGRKPLVLVRAALLGLLLPATGAPEKDREVFLKIMTMDRDGLWRRKKSGIPSQRLVQELLNLSPGLQSRFLETDRRTGAVRLKDLDRAEKDELQRLVFERLPYDEKLRYCHRPEQIEGPSPEVWAEINAHLGTHARGLSELVNELGQRRFGRRPRVGDAFCGGGSVPFEAARLGCDVYGSDLNPVASLLTWASLNIVGGGKEALKKAESARETIYDAVEQQVLEWGIEINSMGWRADAFLYCVEVTDPETGWKIPLLPSLVIGKKTNTIAKLVPDSEHKRFEIEIHQGVSKQEMEQADANVTDRNSRVYFPGTDHSTPVEIIRRNMRQWEKLDFMPRPTDVFQERLFCIRWLEFNPDGGNSRPAKHYRAPNAEDWRREEKVIALLRERFDDWQARGYLPSRRIEPGAKTDEPIRTRGWTHWHHLFTPRQLLVLGLLSEKIQLVKQDPIALTTSILSLMKCANWFSKLCMWDSSTANEKTSSTFTNQALNPMSLYGSRSMHSLSTSWFGRITNAQIHGKGLVSTNDARATQIQNDIWITDPPYADAVNYHELSEYFLAWIENRLTTIFPKWYSDSKRVMAVKGNNDYFRQSMVESYRALADHMPDNGLQLVMFTHQDATVWADLSLILWAAGLRVTAAWTIATETDSALKQGNYVQGTVLLVLRKRTESEPVFLDEITHKVEAEVRRQLDEMTLLEDDSDPNFGDADYQLAAYAAALRVLTERPIEEINPEKEILRERRPGEESQVEKLIRAAVRVACDHLVPRGLDPHLWRSLGPMERFYLKGLEVESHGEYRAGVYQELARGFGATAYPDLLENSRANETRLKSASEFGRRMLSGDGFGATLLRHCLFAVFQTVRSEDTLEGLTYLHTELQHHYWVNREKIIHLLDYLAQLRHAGPMAHWHKDSNAAALLAGAVRNDHV